ncbi:uncharacterized protein BCR38DRAFT_88722 [Pseudomassariella vexata]|uniref:Uncharacterized protein n=1 Tax=Pseudomassariella vexata TaxID=1141098 RepID=A0A1Y2EDE4_9PEZI|nr:uncharacterized protein BCR38DRAFT_88722 [Pseudomassariella vexata]ORY69598.1 hypothetical protein BCR38DRAFT_88722 [Pseudomassariella vexata]
MSEDKLNSLQSPASNVSPRSQPMPKQKNYFESKKDGGSNNAVAGAPLERTAGGGVIYEVGHVDLKGKGKDIDNTSDASATDPGDAAMSPGSRVPLSRKASVSSVTFRKPQDPALPQGAKKPHGGRRIRDASPPHRSFSTIFRCKSLPYIPPVGPRCQSHFTPRPSLESAPDITRQSLPNQCSSSSSL